MRYKDIIKEVDHNPSVIKIDYDTLQTLIYLGIGQGTWGIGYADVNNYVALIGQVGHGIGNSGGIMNPAQQQDPESDTKAIISPKDYGDDSDKIAGQYNTTTGEISINQELVSDLKPGVNRIMGAQRASTIVHEMMHRGFDIISRTPELVRVMPEDVKGYWLDDWGRKSGKYYIGRLQASAEHAMIYTHELGPERFSWNYTSLSFRDLTRAIRSGNTAGIEELASAGLNILYCRLDAVADRNSPVYNMRPMQLYRYWRDQFDLINEGLASHFQRVGPPRRFSRGGYERGRAARAQAALKHDFSDIDWASISNLAASLMGQTNTQEQLRAALGDAFEGYAVSNTWLDTVAEMLARAVEADDERAVNSVIQRIKDILNR